MSLETETFLLLSRFLDKEGTGYIPESQQWWVGWTC